MNTVHRIYSSVPARFGRRALGIVGWLVVIVGAALVLAPTLFGYERYVITGGSMSPVFERGDIVFAEPVPVDDLGVGDIITYQPPAETGVTQLVTHRIDTIEEAEDGTRLFTTAGDANAAADPWTFALDARDQNVVRHSLPLVGWVFIALANPRWRMFLIAIPATYIAAQALYDISVAARGRRKDKTDAAADGRGRAGSTSLPVSSGAPS